MKKEVKNKGESCNAAKLYKEKIVEMMKQIDDEKFLKRVCISLRDYIKEK